MSGWKRFELWVCRALGGERRGPTGVSCSDCTDDIPFSVSAKLTKRGTPEGAHIEQAMKLGELELKPWLLVNGKANHPYRPIVSLDLLVFISICVDADLLHPEGRDPLAGQDGSTPPVIHRLHSISTSTLES